MLPLMICSQLCSHGLFLSCEEASEKSYPRKQTQTEILGQKIYLTPLNHHHYHLT